MKISEFAKENGVTAKMLRHYDEIGLLKPDSVDQSGYRIYSRHQSTFLKWILILKNLNFSLAEIKSLLTTPVKSEGFIWELTQKSNTIAQDLNESTQKKLQIGKLIKIIEKEGFHVNQEIDLLKIDEDKVMEVMKNMPNMGLFLESALRIFSEATENETICVLRTDLWHFKQINDEYGFSVGDKVIVEVYERFANTFETLPIALGRAHGDEFILLARVDEETIKTLAAQYVQSFSRDFSAIGCIREVGCYVGVAFEKKKNIVDFRQMIDNTHQLIEKARQQGKNSIICERNPS